MNIVYCRGCRKPLEASDMFCKQCGTDQRQNSQHHPSVNESTIPMPPASTPPHPPPYNPQYLQPQPYLIQQGVIPVATSPNSRRTFLVAVILLFTVIGIGGLILQTPKTSSQPPQSPLVGRWEIERNEYKTLGLTVMSDISGVEYLTISSDGTAERRLIGTEQSDALTDKSKHAIDWANPLRWSTQSLPDGDYLVLVSRDDGKMWRSRWSMSDDKRVLTLTDEKDKTTQDTYKQVIRNGK